jgi:flagellar biosynthesis regulator FlaF
MKRYSLEVKAKFEQGSLATRKTEQLAKDIARRILNVHHPESDDEQIIRESSFASPLFHRLYTDLVDEDNTLVKKVEELREDYSFHRASFSLTPQTD